MNRKKLTPVEALKMAQKLFPWAKYISCQEDIGWRVTDKMPNDDLWGYGRWSNIDCEIDFDGPWQESLHDENGRVQG